MLKAFILGLGGVFLAQIAMAEGVTGDPEAGRKFVLVQLRLEARMKIGYAVVPQCFRLVDDEGNQYYPLSRSPLFLELTDEFFLDRDEVVNGELLFEIPEERSTSRLLFDRYQE